MSERQDDTTRSSHRKSRKVFAIVRRLFLILVGVIVGVTLYFANAQKILGNQLPMPFGYGIANVLSGSMEPTFSTGTLLIIKEERNLEEGDIVVYQSGNSLVVHRIIKIQKDQITTQGDANNAPDPVFDRKEIKGVVIGWVPYLGTVLNLLRTPAGVILLLLLAFFLIEGSFRKEKEEDEKELDAIKEEIRRLKEENSEK